MKKKVFAIFHGGVNYNLGGLEDVEEFESLAAAKDTLWGRVQGFNPDWPNVEADTACMDIYFEDPREADKFHGDIIADRTYAVGPKGGVTAI